MEKQCGHNPKKRVVMKIYACMMFFGTFSVQDNNCDIQKLVLKEILNDQTIQVFFENRKELLLVDNSGCFKERFNLEGYTFIINNDFLEPSLEFYDFKKINNCIVVELKLFNKNTLYKATFKISDTKIHLNNSYVTQIRQSGQ